MTPEQLEALADRVEVGDATNAEIACAIQWLPNFANEHLRRQLLIWRHDGPWVCVFMSEEPEVCALRANAPAYLTSLDAASVMPEGWRVVTIYETAFGKISASYAHRERGWGASGTATNECADRVAAGLRARAHDARKAGAA